MILGHSSKRTVLLLALSSLVLAPPVGAQATRDLGRRYVEWFRARDAEALAQRLSDAGRQRHASAEELERQVFPGTRCLEPTLIGESYACGELEGSAPLCRYERTVRCRGLDWDTSFHAGMDPYSGRLDYVYRVDHRPVRWFQQWQKELLIALVVFVILTTAAGLVIGGRVRSRQRVRAWLAAAEGLGLRLEEQQDEHRQVSGSYRGADVTVGVTAFRSRRARSTNVTYDPWVRVRFPAPLGLGLQVLPTVGPLFRRMAAPFDKQRFETGNAEFDEIFTTRAADEVGARRFLDPPDGASPEVANLLVGHPEREYIRIDDEAVTLRAREFGEENAVRNALDIAAALARVLWEARQATRP